MGRVAWGKAFDHAPDVTPPESSAVLVALTALGACTSGEVAWSRSPLKARQREFGWILEEEGIFPMCEHSYLPLTYLRDTAR